MSKEKKKEEKQDHADVPTKGEGATGWVERVRPKAEDILAEPGGLQDAKKREIVIEYLLLKDPYGLAPLARAYFRKKWPSLPLEEALEAFNSFLPQLEGRLIRYNPGRGSLRNYLRVHLLWACREWAREVWARRRVEIGPSLAMEKRLIEQVQDFSQEGNPERRVELLMDVQSAILRLPPQYRRALLLHVKGMMYSEIAKTLGVSLQVVKNQIHRAYQQLREDLAGFRFRRRSSEETGDGK